ncbi:AGE family epimerase/isomerase [Maritalea myrionectae]|nr:AGE family epimerase/isomerase [Maritalea myrionectae]
MNNKMDWKNRLLDWRNNYALPLWTTTGVDGATGMCWEGLDHSGRPLASVERRLRVQARQVYCFSRSTQKAHQELAQNIFRKIMSNCFENVTGYMASALTPTGEPKHFVHDLYDLAFVFLAAASLLKANIKVEAELALLERALNRLEADAGWHESILRTTPRRQNPHMHLFEAMIGLYQVTGSNRFLNFAEQCLELFSNYFLQSNGEVFEFFNTDFVAYTPPKQSVEPGHAMEWIFLLDVYESVTNKRAGIPLELIFSRASETALTSGLLPDTVSPLKTTSRLWPQLEFLKASIVLEKRGAALPKSHTPTSLLEKIWKHYFEGPVRGGWYDKVTEEGNLLSTTMPASSLYHIFCAFDCFIESQ